MKKFKMTSRFFGHMKNSPVTEFTEEDPPEWLVRKDTRWWWDNHVKKIEVGQHIDSDFQRIERTA